MNRLTVMGKDRLAAFVDGELSPEEAAAVVMHLANHPQDQAFVDDLTAANAALSQAFAPVLDEPVPAAIGQLFQSMRTDQKVLPFRRKPALNMIVPLVGGLAAGAAMAAGLAVMLFIPTVDPHDLTPGPLAADNALTTILASVPSGVTTQMEDGAEVVILATLPTPDGFCREIEVIHDKAGRLDAALVCHNGAGWTVEVMLAEALVEATADEGFGTASGTEAQSFGPFLDRVGAGAVLTPQEEAAAMALGWAK